MIKTNKLSNAIRYALLTSIASLTTNVAFAQETQEVEVSANQSSDVLIEDSLAEDSLEEVTIFVVFSHY